MSLTLERGVDLWAIQPGLGISVDLTPHEVADARQVRVHQRLVGLCLVLVVLVCAGLTMMTLQDRSAARTAYAAAQAQTAQDQADVARYHDIAGLTAITDQIGTQVTGLMKNDVDFVRLLARIRAGLPDGLQITSESVLLAPTDTPAGTPAAGGTVIGAVSLAGSGTAIGDLAPFLAMLNHLRGVVDVVPTSTAKSDTGMTYTLTMNITDVLYTHRFDKAAR